jgi:hypothetical protein
VRRIHISLSRTSVIKKLLVHGIDRQRHASEGGDAVRLGEGNSHNKPAQHPVRCTPVRAGEETGLDKCTPYSIMYVVCTPSISQLCPEHLRWYKRRARPKSILDENTQSAELHMWTDSFCRGLQPQLTVHMPMSCLPAPALHADSPTPVVTAPIPPFRPLAHLLPRLQPSLPWQLSSDCQL